VKKTINNTTIETAVDFFYPFLGSDDKIQIGFYVGEPLLAYKQMKNAVLILREKNKKENKKKRIRFDRQWQSIDR
jgi:sulfatase maturation enzyme AslB (radical SAM superfamily)